MALSIYNTTKIVTEFEDRNASYIDNTTESLLVYNERYSSYLLYNTTESLTDLNDRYYLTFRLL